MKKFANRFEMYKDSLTITGVFIILFIFLDLSLNQISNESILTIFLVINIYFIIRTIFHFISEDISFIKLFIPLLVGLISTAYLVYELKNITLVFDNVHIYIIILLIIGEIIASTTVSSIRISVYRRSTDDKSKAYLPKLPLTLKSKFNFLVINIVLFALTLLLVMFLFDEALKSFWYIVFLIPTIIHLLSLIPYFLFLNTSIVESNKKMFEEEDKNFLLDSIGKKLANKASKSCRKTSKEEYEIVKQCLQNGLDPNEIFEDRYTLLLPSTCCGDEKLVRLLIDSGANVNFRSKLGMTPIYLASQHDAYDLTKLLIDNGAIIDIPSTKEVKSPLIEATIQGNELIVRVLLDAGADINIKDLQGKTALNYATENDFQGIVKILESIISYK